MKKPQKAAPKAPAQCLGLLRLKTKGGIIQLQAVKGFPKNINVSATLSLVGLGAKKTKVRIIAAPQMLVNVHEVYVQGDFGSFYTRTENFPSEQNPKTSHLAILSAVATLERILRNVKIGT